MNFERYLREYTTQEQEMENYKATELIFYGRLQFNLFHLLR